MDYSQSPFLVIWETTRACDLACVHCRASADPMPAPDELNHEEARHLIDEVKEIGTPIFIFSGGDCLKRPDLIELIKYAKSKKLRTGAIPAVTSALTDERLIELRDSGLDQIAFSLDASNAQDHDSFRRTEGVFERTLQAIKKSNQLGMRVQINSLINVHNENQLAGLFEIITSFNLVFWEIFFLVPTGRGEGVPLMSAEKFEETFEKIYEYSQTANFIIKITEAPHYRRFCDEKLKQVGSSLAEQKMGHRNRMPDNITPAQGFSRSIGRAPMGVNSGKGFTFISYRGEIMPSGFLPISGGNIRKNSLSDVYRNSSLFQDLRNTNLLKGRCGICSYKDLCGGSRARAYALTGDCFAEDPCCAYQPAEFSEIKGRV